MTLPPLTATCNAHIVMMHTVWRFVVQIYCAVCGFQNRQLNLAAVKSMLTEHHLTRPKWWWLLHSWGPVWSRERCRISPPCFLVECCKRQLNQGSFVLLYFTLFTFSGLYWVCLSVFSCTVLFASTSQVIGCEDRLWNYLYCVECSVKLYSNQPTKLHSWVPSQGYLLLKPAVPLLPIAVVALGHIILMNIAAENIC